MNNFDPNFGTGATAWIHTFLPELILLAAWSIFWKGLALWHSAKRGQPWWFVIFLIINTAGILEIIYLFWVLKLKFSDLFNKK